MADPVTEAINSLIKAETTPMKVVDCDLIARVMKLEQAGGITFTAEQKAAWLKVLEQLKALIEAIPTA